MSGPEDLDVVAVVYAYVLDDGHGVGRGAAVVGLRLHLGGGVDVHHDNRRGVALLPVAKPVGRDRLGKRAACVVVRDQHGLVGREARGRLGHEVQSAEHDQLRIGT
jgi:hypothetical protein